jgi:hypothetical protein
MWDDTTGTEILTIQECPQTPSRARSTYLLRLHDQTIDRLVDRLTAEAQFDEVSPKKLYSNGGYSGEVDVLARKGNVVYFYEVKANEHPKNFVNATDQFWKYCRAHPGETIIGVYVTPTCEKPLPPHNPTINLDKDNILKKVQKKDISSNS